VRLSYFIARRYFLSRKKKTFINVISIISMVVVGISTMALVVVLSVFNGLEGLLRNLYGSFDADIVVLPSEGKTFILSDTLKNQLNSTEGVLSLVEVIEDNALIKYKGAQRVVRVKGVGEGYIEQGRFDDALIYGDLSLKKENAGYAIVGRGIQYDLSIHIEDEFQPLVMYYPKDIGPGQLNPERMFNVQPVAAGGIFAIEKFYDDNYIFVPIEITQQLFQLGEERTALELAIDPSANPTRIKEKIVSALGPSYQVKLNEEIHGSLYRILKWEKLFVFLTFAIIIAIGSINIYFSLSMLVIDKQKDLAILKAIGAPAKLLSHIILTNGTIIAFVGAFSGLLIGLLISWAQQEFGLISMGVPGAISDAYPVKIKWFDVLGTTALVVVVTLLASIQPARKASKMLDLSHLQ
jgi:lipoprotein-releasing system permease protein